MIGLRLQIIENNNKIHPNVRMLCLCHRLLYIKIEDVVQMQMYDKTKDYFYDIDLNIMNIGNNKITIPKEFKDIYIARGIPQRFLFPDKDGKKPVLLHNLYKAFRNAAGFRYVPNTIILNDTPPGNFVEWSSCILPTWKQKTYELYCYIIKKLQTAQGHNTDFYYPDLFINKYEDIIKNIADFSVAPASKELYIKAILVYLQHFNISAPDMPMSIFARYTIEKTAYENAEMIMKEVPNYKLIIEPKFISLLESPGINVNLKIIILIFLEIGILRYSDLIWTKVELMYNPVCEYSQLCPDYYYIAGRYTKNGRDRKIKIPDDFYSKLIKINDITPGNWLLDYYRGITTSPSSSTTPTGTTPTEITTPTGTTPIGITIIAKDIKKHIGYNLNILRGSLETYAVKNYTKEKSEELSYAMGHIFKTVIKYYYRD
jgi:hypothetical protein